MPIESQLGKRPAVGVLCNPCSGRARKRLDAIRRSTAAAVRGGVYREARTPPEIAAVLDEFAAASIDILVIIGGDGTVHAVLSHLLGVPLFGELPDLVIVPGGTTNMTAADLGVRGDPLRVLAGLGRLLAGSAAPAVKSRSVLRLDHQNRIWHGMFFGAGIIAAGVRYFQERIQRLGITGEAASAIVVARFLAAQWLRRRPAPDAILASIRTGKETAPDGHYLLFLATALDRLLLGTRPFWGREEGPIHVTVVESAPRRFWRTLPAALCGHGRRVLEADGYRSCNVQALELSMDGEFVVDGQLYPVQRSRGPVRISAAGPVRFLAF